MSKKILIGKVISDKMQKTVVVGIELSKAHPIYGKVIASTKKLKAHNDLGAKVGDMVTIEECKPMSKEKFFKVVKVN